LAIILLVMRKLRISSDRPREEHQKLRYDTYMAENATIHLLTPLIAG